MTIGGSIATVCRWLASCVGHFLLWSFWLVLVAIFIVLVMVARSHELRVPASLIQVFRHRLAVAGLHVSFDSARFDPTGHILIENLQVFGDSFDEPLLTCPSIFAHVDPWALAVGSLRVDAISGHQLNLYVPAMFSPTGKSEPVISDLDFAVAPNPNGWIVQRLAARSGKLIVSGRGQIDRIQKPGTKKQKAPNTLLSEYLHAASQWALWQNRLEAFEEPTLRIVFAPDSRAGARARVTFLARSIDLTAAALPASLPEKFVRARDFRIETTVPITSPGALDWQLSAAARDLATSDGTAVQAFSLQVSGHLQPNPFAFSFREAKATASTISLRGMTISDLALAADLAQWPQFAGSLSTRLTDQNWGLQATGDAKSGSAQISAEGKISAALIALVGEIAHRDFSRLLTVPEPASLALQATWAEKWQLRRATARLEARNVTAQNVFLQRASGTLDYDGHSAAATDIVLIQPGNRAFGSYWMDTKTLDYRFLLTGELHPDGIDGWFHEWWPHFWSRFDFSQAAPIADVDVQGRWREPHLSNIFIHVEAAHPQIRSVSFDLVRTTLFIRPDFYDALEVYAKRGAGEARGRFTRSVDLDEDEYRWLDFDVKTNLDIGETAKLFGDDGTGLVQPYVFAQPPTLRISGKLQSQYSTTGQHEDIFIGVDSIGGFRFFDFPLNDLHCEATVHDDTITVDHLQVGFADGIATGQAKVTGQEPARHISLTTDLRGANLGEAIATLEAFGAREKGLVAKGPSVFQERVAKGKLDLQAAAEGDYHNLLSFVGAGHAELHGGDLGQINLLGALSAALRGNSVLGFTSWNLDTARADFTLDRDNLLLQQFQITGPTAKIDGKGSFSLATKTIDVNAKFYPFDQGKTLLANAVGLVLSPVSAVLELKLSGSLSKPKWFFAYGPTSLIRKIAGNDKTQEAPTAPAIPAQPAHSDYTPPPFLRRSE